MLSYYLAGSCSPANMLRSQVSVCHYAMLCKICVKLCNSFMQMFMLPSAGRDIECVKLVWVCELCVVCEMFMKRLTISFLLGQFYSDLKICQIFIFLHQQNSISSDQY